MSSRKIHSLVTKYLGVISQIIAYTISVALLIAAMMITLDVFKVLYVKDLDTAIQDGLFVLILLEMFYITRSFIKYGSINVSLIINVGIIAAVKEMIFQLDNLTWKIALAFGILFLTLSIVYLIEMLHFENKKAAPN